MARTFRDKDTALLAAGQRVARFHAIQRQAAETVEAVLTADGLQDLRNVPGNRLEALRGSREGQYSVRINNRWRVCFEWSDAEERAVNIEIVDYHSSAVSPLERTLHHVEIDRRPYRGGRH